jgi:hypothetical protein
MALVGACPTPAGAINHATSSSHDKSGNCCEYFNYFSSDDECAIFGHIDFIDIFSGIFLLFKGVDALYRFSILGIYLRFPYPPQIGLGCSFIPAGGVR